MVLGFVQGARGDSEEAAKLLGKVAAKPFGRVSRRRTGRFANLIAVFEIPGNGRLVSKCKHFTLQLVCELPGNEILESPHTHAHDTSTSRTTDVTDRIEL